MSRNFLDDLLPIRRILVDGEEQPFVADIDFDSETFEVEVDEETGVLSVSGLAYPHGDQAGGSLHALAVASGAAGFLSGADKAKLDGITAANAAPPAIGAAGVVGVSTEYAREEHTHALGPGPFGATDFDTITVNGGSAFACADDGIGNFGASVEAPVVYGMMSVETPLVHSGAAAVGLDGSDGVELYHNGNATFIADLVSSVARLRGLGISGTRIEGANAAGLELRGDTGVTISHATNELCTLTRNGSNQVVQTVTAARAGFGFEATGASQYIYLRCGSSGAVYADCPTFYVRNATGSSDVCTIANVGNVTTTKGFGSSGADFASNAGNVYLSAASTSYSVFLRAGATPIVQAANLANIALFDLVGSAGNEIRGMGGPTMIRGASGSYIGLGFGGSTGQRTKQEHWGRVQTTDATVTTAWISPAQTNGVNVHISAVVVGNTNGGDGATYELKASFRTTGGTTTQIGTTTVTHTGETAAGWDCTFDVTSNTIRIRVTGAAATNIAWEAYPTLFFGGSYA